MTIKEVLIKPFEVVAGSEYPNIDTVRREATEDGSSGHEVEMCVSFERQRFFSDLIHLNGVTRALPIIRKGR